MSLGPRQGQTDRQRERAKLGMRIYLLMLLLTALSYRPFWTPRLLLPPATYAPKDQRPGSPHRSPRPRQNVRVLSVPGANRDLLFTGKSTSQRNTYYSAFHTAKIPRLHFQNCGLCIMQNVVFGHECDAWKKQTRRPYLLTYPLTNWQMSLDISLQQKLKSFQTNSTACSLHQCPLLHLMLKLSLLISSLCPKRKF